MRLVIGFVLLGLLAVLTVPMPTSSKGQDERAGRRAAPRKRVERAKPAKRARRPATKPRLAGRAPAA